MKQILFLLFVLSCMIAGSSTAFSQKEEISPVVLDNTRFHILNSKHVGESYQIPVSLPPSYNDSTKSYPTLYILDSDKSFGMAHDIVSWLYQGREIPELIIVGISYGQGTKAWWQKRSRDYTPTPDRSRIWGDWPLAGGANHFKTFLKDELFPFVETAYRAHSNDRLIAGLSFGGLFESYVLFGEPELFHGYIIISPGLIWDHKRILEYEAAYHSAHDSLSAIVFTAIGKLDPPSIINPWREFNDLIQKRGYKELKWVTHEFEDETHWTVLPVALTRGLKILLRKSSQ